MRRSAYVHPLLEPIADRLRALGDIAIANDLGHLGGELCSEGNAPLVLEHLVARIERLTREVAELRGELKRREVASGMADLRERVAELEAQIARGAR
jgi:hypothetical protein